MSKREDVITNLRIIRTWAKVDGESGRGIDPRCCADIVAWTDEVLAMIDEKPRVMTLEEAQSTDYVWYEVRSTGLVYPVSVRKSLNTLNGYYAADIQQIGCGESKFMPEKEYGKTWRCWTFKPTDEQRKVEAWQQQA